MPTQNIIFWIAMFLLASPIFGVIIGKYLAKLNPDEEEIIYTENWDWPERWCDHGEA